MILPQLIADKKGDQHVFGALTFNDRRRHFLIDSGSDVTFIFIKPMGGILHKTWRDITWLSKTGKAQLITVDRDPMWYCDKPIPVLSMEKAYGLQVSGILGVDWLIRNKIVLDFSKM